MIELKPCPFCGGNAKYYYSPLLFSTEYEVRCLRCGCRTMTYKSNDSLDAKQLANQAWNRRDGDDNEIKKE